MRPATVLAAVAAVLLLTAAVVGWQRRDVTATTDRSGTLAGAALFRVKGCSSCHEGPDSAPIASGPPDLSDAPAWAGHRIPGLDAAGYLRQSILDPGAFTAPGFRPDGGPVTAMPTLSVSKAEVDALVAYLLHR